MASTEQTPRYRNFSSNMPLSTTTVTPRAPSTLITVEKEPERDPEADCFMCRQSHVYVKPIGMHQERRVARRHPPPLTRAQIDALSQKKHLSKQEVRKLLQCYFPEIKDVKYFQLHKYHSCCYDPKHLNLCKNHITAFQHERNQDTQLHNHGDIENPYKEHEREGAQPPNRVSFVRIKIEPTKGIPTRFLGPTALPESLADMLLKQVNRVEEKKPAPSFNPNNANQPYKIRRIHQRYDDDEDDEGEGEEEEDNDDEEDEEDEDETNQRTHGTGKKPKKIKLKTSTKTGDMVVEDIEELNRLNLNQQAGLKRKKRKKTTKKKNGQDKSKLNHWELMALDQAQQEPCNCRHHVMRVEGDQVVYDWCRCKDNQHKEIIERRKSITVSPPSPPTPPPPPVRRPKPETPPVRTAPPSPPPQPKTPKPKQKKIQHKSIGIDATGPPTTELALAYDPSAVDYDMIQETIYYRTSSGRLIKPEISNAFTYDTMPPAITTTTLDRNDPVRSKAEVLYMAPNGQIQPFESGGLPSNRGRITDRSLSGPKSLVLSNPGSLYNGHARIDTDHSTPTNRASATMPVLRLPPSVTSSRRGFIDDNNNVPSINNNDYHPAEFTLATFSPEKNINTPASRRSLASGSPNVPPHLSSQRSTTSDSQNQSRNASVSKQRSTKPTYSNFEPTPDYGRESSIIANRRWFDQPLGDQNLRPVHDGQYGLIAGSTNGQQSTTKNPVPEYNHYMNTNSPKNDSNCTIS